jgi:hypothetical protein
MNIRAKIYGGGSAAGEPLIPAKKPKGAKADSLDSIAVQRESRQRRDSRGEDRHRLVGERAKATYEGSIHDVEVINLSGGGAMIQGALRPMLWDRLVLHLGEHGDVECAVRWIRDGRTGLEFAHETRLDCDADEIASVLREVITRSFQDYEFAEPVRPAAYAADEEPQSAAPVAALEPEDRTGPRHPLIWTGTLYHDFQTTPVRLRNISQTGAMIECDKPVRVGSEPLLELSEAVSVSATVQWTVGDQVGLRFHQPFDMNLLAESRPQVVETNWTPPAYLGKPADDVAEDAGGEHWDRLTLYQLREELEGFLKY